MLFPYGKLVCHFFQIVGEFILIHGFGNIIFYIIPHGLLRIFKIGISAEYYNDAAVSVSPGKPGYIQAAEPRHTDI